MAIAPAITLNRMYHCVPSSISGMEPMPDASAEPNEDQQQDGKNAGAGTDAAICAIGCAMRASRG